MSDTRQGLSIVMPPSIPVAGTQYHKKLAVQLQAVAAKCAYTRHSSSDRDRLSCRAATSESSIDRTNLIAHGKKMYIAASSVVILHFQLEVSKVA